jgi:3-phosphoshikimate 1-carboxyvinyltransferase
VQDNLRSNDLDGETIILSSLPRVVSVRGGQPNSGETVELQLPGAKYYTLRYLLAALLAEIPAGTGSQWETYSFIRNPALSDDTLVLTRALRALGARVEWAESLTPDGMAQRALFIGGTSGRLATPPGGVVNAGNAGAVLRLLLGLGALLPQVRFETTHPDSLGRRPNAELLHALQSLGVQVEATWPEGLLPIMLRGGPPRGGTVTISGARSSQFLSALLYLGPLLEDGLDITVVEGLRSAPIVRATIRVLAEAGVAVVASEDFQHVHVPGRQRFQRIECTIPGDAPSAAALLAAGIAAAVPLSLRDADPMGEEMQSLIGAFRALDAPVELLNDGTVQQGIGQLQGTRIDGDPIIDSVPALVAAACFAEGTTRFENVATLRLKESNRIDDLCTELRCAGCDVEAEADAIVVRGRPEGIAGGATVDGHDDHRLVQALATVALRSRDGLTITGADAVAKSYPAFFEELARIGAEIGAVD